MMLREFIQQGFIGEESLRQPFGIIQSFNRKDILNVLEFVLELGKLRRQRTGGLLGNFVWLNTDWVDFGMEISSPRSMRFTAVSDQPGFARHAVEEGQPVIFRLETEQVVI